MSTKKIKGFLPLLKLLNAVGRYRGRCLLDRFYKATVFLQMRGINNCMLRDQYEECIASRGV
jgi:hypothetical protein